MRKNLSFWLTTLIWGLWGHVALLSQTTLVCNDFVYIALDDDCSHRIASQEVLEGGPYCCYDAYIVELDKTAPFGNGPWVFASLGKDDVNKTYQVRITDPASNIRCWGSVRAEDKNPPKLKCNGLTLANLAPSGSTTLTIADMNIFAEDGCSLPAEVSVELVGIASVTYDCDYLGMQQVSIKATDAFGNATTCQHNVLVRDSANYCIGPSSGCTTGCPPSVVETFAHGYNVLLPAFQNNDWSVFDPYGSPTFDGGCTPSDTTYNIIYTAPSNGQSWFTREWNLTVSGIPFGRCKQWVVFPDARALTLTGHVFVDTLINCNYDGGEPGISFFKVSATRLPSQKQIVVTPDASGAYSITLESNQSDTSIVVRLELPSGFATACPTVYTLPAGTPQTSFTLDFGLTAQYGCPQPQVSIGASLLRRCFDQNYYQVQYCNTGLLPLEDAYVVVTLDSLLEVMEASIPYVQNGQEYTFQLGDLAPLACDHFWVRTKVSCNTTLGQTLCAKATIYPHDPCEGAGWNGPFVEARAVCEGDSVRLEVRNTGQQDMTEMLDFIVVEDIIMRSSQKFMLPAGQSAWVKQPANGSTWRIMADQVSGYPFSDRPTAFVETCGGLNTPGLPNAFPMNDDPLYQDEECIAVIGSYDPNDKSAAPTGHGAAHTITANTDLEYKIRFQNTGTDTAFTVVVVDRLSDLLDWSTLEAGVASHPYRLDVLPGGVLRFVFNDILLPDSNTNLAGSQGFVKFRIAQKRDLPDGTVFENNAAIYFDFNAPIITNTVFHTIGERYVTVSSTHQSFLPNVEVQVRPNPFQDRAVLEVKGHEMSDGWLRLYNAQGQVLRTQTFEGNQCTLHRQGLPVGTYFYLITDNGASVSSGQVQVK